MKFNTICCFCFLISIAAVEANDFSSFLSANASLAVVVDSAYMKQHNENILANIQKILGDIIRENLKNGGINVKYYTWTGILLKKDYLAAIIITDCQNTWSFYKAAQLTSVLLIAITDADCPRLPPLRALMIPLVERGEEFSQMILDTKVQQILKWKTATLLLDQTLLNANDNLIKSIVQDSAENSINPIALILHQLDDNLKGQKKRIALRKVFQTFAHQNYDKRQQFLVISQFYEEIIEIAESLDLFNVRNQWMFFVLGDSQNTFNASSVTLNLDEGANIAFVFNETSTNCVDTLNCTIAEISMAFVTSISRMILEEQSIYGEISDEEWESIRYTKQEKQTEILGFMKEYLKNNSKCSSCSKWRIETAITWGKSQVYKKYRNNAAGLRESRNQNFDFIDVGYWTPVLGYVTHELTFPHIEHYFRNLTLNVATVHNPPWQILRKDSKGVIIEHSGIVMEILKELSRMLNFTYHLYEVPGLNDDDSANSNVTDTLIGSLTYLIPYKIIELAQGDRYLIAAVAATIDEPSRKAFNYTIPISVQKYSFITRKPDEISRVYLFTAPFTLETWGCLVGVLLLTAPVLYVINRLVPMDYLKIQGFCTIKNCFWYIYGALLQQGGMYLPKADSGRLVIGVWWIVVIVLVTTYCGNLVAFLTFPKFQPGIDYLFQLFKHTEIKQYGIRNGSFFEKYAMSTTRNDILKYMDNAIVYNNLQSEDIEAVKEGKRVNIDWRINLQLIIQNHFEHDKECAFSLGKENFVEEKIGFIVPSDSPYLDLINERIKRMFQMGFIERWHQTNLPSMDKCNGKGIFRQITNHKVNLDDMQGCFLILLFGFITALSVIICEFWHHRYYTKKLMKARTFSN